jgi:type I restriction enzyme M protein
MAMTDLTADGNLESKLWNSAEQLRGTIESAQYKYVVLEILSIKAFSEEQEQIGLTIPKDANWDSVVSQCESIVGDHQDGSINEEIGKIVERIETSNPGYSDIFPRGHNRSGIPNPALWKLIETFDDVEFNTEEARDPLGRVYEYFLREFAREEGRRSGEFYTPKCVVDLLVRILEPYSKKVFDPFCGSGGMFIQSAQFLEKHDESVDINIHGQELKEGTWRICRANLTRAGLPISNIKQGDSILDDQHKELKADRIITNPPFNMEEWGKDELAQDDPRFSYGLPSETGNFAFLQHMIYHTGDDGMVGTVMANRTMFAQDDAEKIRRQIIEDDLLDAVISLPNNLFYSTSIPASIWILTKGKDSDEYRDRSGETLVIDAEYLFETVNNSLNTLTEEHIQKIVSKVRAYRAESGVEPYRNEAGFCRRVTVDEFAEDDYVVTPGGFVGKDKTYKSNLTNEQLTELVDEVNEIFDKSEKLNKQIRRTLEETDEI